MAIHFRVLWCGLALVFLCAPLSAFATAPTPYDQRFFDRQVRTGVPGGGSQMSGTIRQGLPSTSPGGKAVRYIRAQANIPRSTTRAGMMNAAARGIRHPAAMAAVMAAGWVMDQDGNVIDGEQETKTHPSDPNEMASQQSWSTGDICDQVIDKPLGEVVTMYDSGSDEIIGARRHWDTTAQQYCSPHVEPWTPGDWDSFFGEPSDFTGSGICGSSAECEGGNYWPAMNARSIPAEYWDGGESEMAPPEPVSDEEIEDTFTDEQWKRILEDIINTRDPDHMWRDDMSPQIDDEQKPLPPEMQDEMDQVRQDFEDAETEDDIGGQDADDQQVDQMEDLREDLNRAPTFPDEPDAEFEERELAPDGWEPESVDLGPDACPDPYTATLNFGQGYDFQWEVTYDYVCDFADVARPLVIAVAWLIGGFVVVRAVT